MEIRHRWIRVCTALLFWGMLTPLAWLHPPMAHAGEPNAVEQLRPPQAAERADGERTQFLPLVAAANLTPQEDSTPVAAAGATTGAPDLLFYHHDAIGNLLALTAEDGSVIWRADVRPFGAGEPSSPAYLLHFTEQPQEPHTGANRGLCHLDVRYYDPLSGRFLSAEPLASRAKRI